MHTRIQKIALSVALVGLSFFYGASGNEARAADPPKQGSGWHRAGHSDRVAWWARPSNNHRYDGYYVGGGAAYRGDARRTHEGTWGWDYSGGWFGRRIALDWWHGRRVQGGSGAYKSDGPHRHH
ncbi:MAG: hypothetical protein IIA67_03315 [Planctomycetes bacterium]|nr:hypothetical protein [Planctomycetota bacterium]